MSDVLFQQFLQSILPTATGTSAKSPDVSIASSPPPKAVTKRKGKKVSSKRLKQSTLAFQPGQGGNVVKLSPGTSPTSPGGTPLTETTTPIKVGSVPHQVDKDQAKGEGNDQGTKGVTGMVVEKTKKTKRNRAPKKETHAQKRRRVGKPHADVMNALARAAASALSKGPTRLTDDPMPTTKTNKKKKKDPPGEGNPRPNKRHKTVAEPKKRKKPAKRKRKPAPEVPPTPHAPASTSTSFLAYVQGERIKVKQYLEQKEAYVAKVAEVEAELEETHDLAGKKILWKALTKLRKEGPNATNAAEGGGGLSWFSGHDISSVEEFDRCVADFIDHYHKNDFQDEAELVRLFQVELQGLDPDVQTTSHDFCDICGSEYLCSTDDAKLYCQSCTYFKHYIEATIGSVGYEDHVDFTSMSYRRSSHMAEFLSSLTARGSYRMPDAIMDRLSRYCAEQGWDREDITYVGIKDAQKRTGVGRYAHSMQAYARLKGCKPLRLEPRCEERIHLMFLLFDRTFQILKPPERKNALSYVLMTNGFIKLMDPKYHYVLEFLPLLKGEPNRKVQLDLFEKVRVHLDGQLERIARS